MYRGGALCWFFCLLLAAAGCTPASDAAGSATGSTEVEKPTLLQTSCRTMDLGIVLQAGSEQERFELTNPGSELVRVTRVSSSCPCLMLEPIPLEVPPGGSLPVLARLDLASEPQFIGGLSIAVAGYTPVGELAFNLTVEATVRQR